MCRAMVIDEVPVCENLLKDPDGTYCLTAPQNMKSPTLNSYLLHAQAGPTM